PAACASCWQCASAPARPPRSAPLPGPALVMKNVMLFCCAGTLPLIASAITATDANTDKRIAEVISVLPWRCFFAVDFPRQKILGLFRRFRKVRPARGEQGRVR